MTTATFLRTAAVLAAVQGLAHGTLILRAKPRHGPAEISVVQAMQSNQFDFGGATRSYWDFYIGYGLEAAAACVVEAVLFWQLARMAQSQPALVQPTIILFVLVNIGHALLAARYFFYVPVVFDLLIATCLGAARLTAAR